MRAFAAIPRVREAGALGGDELADGAEDADEGVFGRRVAVRASRGGQKSDALRSERFLPGTREKTFSRPGPEYVPPCGLLKSSESVFRPEHFSSGCQSLHSASFQWATSGFGSSLHILFF
jgi:hypothetical protein